MHPNLINAYLERAREIIGERSQPEIDYDDAVIAHLGSKTDIKDIKRAIAAANQKYPEEALKPSESDWPDMAARYCYLKEHKAILARLKIKE